MEEPAFLEPTADSRWKLALLAILGLLFVSAVKVYWPMLTAHIESLPLCDRLPWYQGMLIWFYSLSPFTAVVLIRHARRIMSSGQVPPPHTLVFFRTPIKRGRTAVLHAYASIAIAVAAVVVPIYFAAKVWPAVSPIFMSVAQCRSGGT